MWLHASVNTCILLFVHILIYCYFLKDSNSDAPAPSAFRDLPVPKGSPANGDLIMGVPATPEDHEDLSEFKFAKFAATYFQVKIVPPFHKIYRISHIHGSIDTLCQMIEGFWDKFEKVCDATIRNIRSRFFIVILFDTLCIRCKKVMNKWILREMCPINIPGSRSRTPFCIFKHRETSW